MGFWKDLKKALERDDDVEIDVFLPYEYAAMALLILLIIVGWLVLG